jgi:hypothetical protein
VHVFLPNLCTSFPPGVRARIGSDSRTPQVSQPNEMFSLVALALLICGDVFLLHLVGR